MEYYDTRTISYIYLNWSVLDLLNYYLAEFPFTLEVQTKMCHHISNSQLLLF